MRPTNRRRFLAQSAAIAAGLSLHWPQGTFAAEFEKAGAELIEPALKGIDRGLAWLGGAQQDDGSYGSGGYARSAAVTGLVGMAFLSAGSTPGRGPFGRHVNRCIDFLLNNTEDSGFINVSGTTTHGPMYGHGFATLFLAECYGMTMRNDLRDKLSKAIALIVETQNTDGGWRYQPQRMPGDISVTICQIMALRAARNAGLHVPAETIDRSIDFVKQSQNPDGGFKYMLIGGPSQFARSAAGVVGLYSAGIYDGPEIEKGLTYLIEQLPRGGEVSRDAHFFYGHYYGMQAMWQAGGDHFLRWYPLVRDAVLARQREDGSWMDPICPEYGTAMACIVLQMPNNYLPIFQR